jgi:hypothetical protein
MQSFDPERCKIIDRAEEHFIKALELNPDDEASRKQLENIRKGNERMGRE